MGENNKTLLPQGMDDAVGLFLSWQVEVRMNAHNHQVEGRVDIYSLIEPLTGVLKN